MLLPFSILTPKPLRVLQTPWSRFLQNSFHRLSNVIPLRYSIFFETFPSSVFTSHLPFFCDNSHSASSRQACEKFAKPWSRFSQIFFTAFATSFRSDTPSSFQAFPLPVFSSQLPFFCDTSHSAVSRQACERIAKPWSRFSLLFTAFATSFRPDIPSSFETFPLSVFTSQLPFFCDNFTFRFLSTSLGENCKALVTFLANSLHRFSSAAYALLSALAFAAP
jgi:hypothetical protein